MRATIERDGLLADLEAIGGEVLANACGPCIGQWSRTDLDPSKLNTIVNSYNRNFPKRNDGSANTLAFVTSPDMVIAYALAGTLDFDPLTDTLTNDEGEEVRLEPPVGEDLPQRGFDAGEAGFLAAPPTTARRSRWWSTPTATGSSCSSPSPPWDGNDYVELPVLLKAKGKCTTDHISAAGPWLKYRGHLENISRQPVPRRGQRVHRRRRARARISSTGRPSRSPTSPSTTPRRASAGWRSATRTTARGRHVSTRPWSRGSATARRSSPGRFARIHETNLKKQGVLALTFADPATYDEIGEDDRISIVGPGRPRARHAGAVPIHKPDGSTVDFETTHTMNDEQIEWFRAGGALNIIRQRSAS